MDLLHTTKLKKSSETDTNNNALNVHSVFYVLWESLSSIAHYYSYRYSYHNTLSPLSNVSISLIQYIMYKIKVLRSKYNCFQLVQWKKISIDEASNRWPFMQNVWFQNQINLTKEIEAPNEKLEKIDMTKKNPYDLRESNTSVYYWYLISYVCDSNSSLRRHQKY